MAHVICERNLRMSPALEGRRGSFGGMAQHSSRPIVKDSRKSCVFHGAQQGCGALATQELCVTGCMVLVQLTAVDGRRAFVTLPNDPELVDILAKNGVDISVSEGDQQGNYVSLLGNLLFPLIAFGGLFFLFRCRSYHWNYPLLE